jgi:hypothetical protein
MVNKLFLLPLIILLTAYLIGVAGFSAAIAFRTKIKFLFLLPAVFLAIHISWGIGFLVGIFKSHYK